MIAVDKFFEMNAKAPRRAQLENRRIRRQDDTLIQVRLKAEDLGTGPEYGYPVEVTVALKR